MIKQYYYQILLLLGSLLTVPMHAVHYHKNQDEYKYQEAQQQVNTKTFYSHGDLTFIEREKDNINEEELKQGLIGLFQQIKAKDGRKVYFFVGATGAGKSLSIQALQGNTINKVEDDSSDSEASDETLCNDLNRQIAPPMVQFEIKYVLPKNAVPVVGHGSTGKTDSTYIYYPDAKKLPYKELAFADTEGFFGKRKATSAGKCLSATSFFYTVRANNVGGLVLVISAPELYVGRGDGLKRIAHILQQYFARAVSNQIIKESLLVMITKVDSTSKRSRTEVLRKFRELIQLFYQEYYAQPDNKHFLQKGFDEIGKGAYNGIRQLVDKSESFKKALAEKSKKQDEDRRLKLFFEMLLAKDVPKDKIGDIKNFKLDGKRFCFIFPWDQRRMQKILDKQLKNLKPIASNDLCSFDNPATQYMEAKSRDFSMQLNHAIQPLLSQKRAIDRREKQLKGMTNTELISQVLKKLNDDIKIRHTLLKEIKKDNTLEAVFNQSHYERLPANQGWWSQCVAWARGYKLARAFKYTGKEPIYQIEATYGPEAALSEKLPSWIGGATHNKFIEKHFNITKKQDNNGKVTFKAVTKSGQGITKDTWCLYHITTGDYKAQCKITFYALRRERIATQMTIKSAEKHIKESEISISFYKKADKDYKTLSIECGKETKKWQKQKNIQTKTWGPTAQMLEFFADEILKTGANKRLIKDNLKDFREATQLKSFKSNHQQDKPHPEAANQDLLYANPYQPAADSAQLNDPQ